MARGVAGVAGALASSGSSGEEGDVGDAEEAPSRPATPFKTRWRRRCARGATYALRCGQLDEGNRCFYETSTARMYICATQDCSEGVPAELTDWCAEN